MEHVYTEDGYHLMDEDSGLLRENDGITCFTRFGWRFQHLLAVSQ